MGEKLKNPPLVEAVCEFRFVPTTTWDWTVPGRLFDKVGEEFPVRTQVQGVGVTLQLGRNTLPASSIQTGPDRVQLRRHDGSAMVQVGPNLLAVNHLCPYPLWTTFRSLIMRVYGLHQTVAGEIRLERIGLRYINRIKVPEGPLQIGDYLTLEPPLAGSLAKPLDTFYQRYELTEASPPGVLIHQTGLQVLDRQRFLMLDLDFVSKDVHSFGAAGSVEGWLDGAHDCIHAAFVASVRTEYYSRLRGDHT